MIGAQSEPTLSQVEAVLCAEGLTPREVHARVGAWSRPTIRQSLTELVRQGRARFEGPDCQRRYFRSAPPPAASTAASGG